MHFKNLEGKPERKNPKRIISSCSGLGLLQMVSEPDTGHCASEEVELRKEVDMRRCVRKDAGP